MTNAFKELKKQAESVRLSSLEKSTMREKLVSHMRLRPAPVASGWYQGLFSPIRKSAMRNNKTLPILISLGLLVGGSVSFAAEGTTPGDLLYPVKIYLNENARGALLVTPQKRAEWEMRLVERRLQEMEKVTTQSNVSEKSVEKVQENFEKYTERVNARVAQLEVAGGKKQALDLSERLAGKIQNYEQNLTVKFSHEDQEEMVLRHKEISEDVDFENPDQITQHKREIRQGKTLKRIKEVRERTEKKNQELRDTVGDTRRPLRDKDF